MYAAVRIPVSLALFASICLSPAAAQNCAAACRTHIPAGIVTGTWTAAMSPICVNGNIRVNGLRIMPGVCIKIANNVTITVITNITAIGNAAAPIVFTAQNPKVGWGGMHFTNLGNQRSTLRFCRIEFSNARGLNITNSTVTISDCDIQNNWTSGNGGGMMISLSTGSFTLMRCKIRNNRASGHGGGISCSTSKGSFTLLNCRIDGNQAITTGCGTRVGGGIYCPSASQGLILKNCSIAKNICSLGGNIFCGHVAQGGGLYVANSPLTLRNCILRENLAKQLLAQGAHRHLVALCGSQETARRFR